MIKINFELTDTDLSKLRRTELKIESDQNNEYQMEQEENQISIGIIIRLDEKKRE